MYLYLLCYDRELGWMFELYSDNMSDYGKKSPLVALMCSHMFEIIATPCTISENQRLASSVNLTPLVDLTICQAAQSYQV